MLLTGLLSEYLFYALHFVIRDAYSAIPHYRLECRPRHRVNECLSRTQHDSDTAPRIAELHGVPNQVEEDEFVEVPLRKKAAVILEIHLNHVAELLFVKIFCVDAEDALDHFVALLEGARSHAVHAARGEEALALEHRHGQELEYFGLRPDEIGLAFCVVCRLHAVEVHESLLVVVELAALTILEAPALLALLAARGLTAFRALRSGVLALGELR